MKIWYDRGSMIHKNKVSNLIWVISIWKMGTTLFPHTKQSIPSKLRPKCEQKNF